MTRKFVEERQRTMEQALQEFRQRVAQVLADPRWGYYSDQKLKEYDQFQAFVSAAQVLKAGRQKSENLAKEARAYLEPLAMDLRRSAVDYTSPEQFGSALLVHDREVEGKLNLARIPGEVARVFEDGAKLASSKAGRYAWLRNLDRAVKRAEELEQTVKETNPWGDTPAGTAHRAASRMRPQLEQIAREAHDALFPRHDEFLNRATEAEEDLQATDAHGYHERKMLAVTLQAKAGKFGQNPLIDTFAGKTEEWLDAE